MAAGLDNQSREYFLTQILNINNNEKFWTKIVEHFHLEQYYKTNAQQYSLPESKM